MIDSYLFAWGAWILGGAVCLVVWARMLNRLPEWLFYTIWWATLGALFVPVAESAGSNLLAPAIFSAVFDLLNGVDGGFMRAGRFIVSAAIAGAIIGVLLSIFRTRKRLDNVGS
ncbi:hypothetical protein [uncultured Umboniibacter sp.]|uniref:hypothetical protein n=1 Tax=uncultured Umboniibacter sp. TaxID=1798917 RepID=UPI00260CA32E|nr:hypothetical protein [uncultured Umboniibacter sp.]